MIETAGTDRWFFPALAGALLAVLLTGFAPTFYLRSLFDVPPIPGYLYVHGAVLTAWFVLVFVQTSLVAGGRTDLHRRLGVATAVVAGLLVPISSFVVLRAIPRYTAAGMSPAAMQFIVIGDFLSLVLFTLMVAAALGVRHRAGWHKRFMMMACIVIFGPVIGRFERLGLAVPPPPVLLLLLITIAVYDVASLGRIHRATMWGSLLVVAALGVVGLAVGSAAGGAFVDALR
jgi:hypothetical protein